MAAPAVKCRTSLRVTERFQCGIMTLLLALARRSVKTVAARASQPRDDRRAHHGGPLQCGRRALRPWWLGGCRVPAGRARQCVLQGCRDEAAFRGTRGQCLADGAVAREPRRPQAAAAARARGAPLHSCTGRRDDVVFRGQDRRVRAQRRNLDAAPQRRRRCVGRCWVQPVGRRVDEPCVRPLRTALPSSSAPCSCAALSCPARALPPLCLCPPRSQVRPPRWRRRPR